MRDFGPSAAFRSFEGMLSYADVDRLSDALAAYLHRVAGISKGDRVAVMLPNLLAFPVAFIAIAKLGAVQVSVNPLYTARELEHQLRDAGTEVIVAYNGATSTVAQVLAKTGLRSVITVGLGELLGSGAQGPEVDQAITGNVTLSDALAAGKDLQATLPEISGDDMLLLQYTGGTTGLSKGAILSHRNLSANIEQFEAIMAGTLRPRQEVVVTAIPLYHIFALMVNFLTYFSIGAENWLVPDGRDARALIDVLKAARPTAFVGVNTLYAALCAHPEIQEIDWSALRLCLGGGAPVLRTTSERWRAITACFIHEGYGLSETSPVISFNPPEVQAFNGTVGLPVPSTWVKLLDADDLDVTSSGESGEICVKGPQVMQGYWRKPEANAAAFTADGYLRTGDIGRFDDRGFLKIIDRKKDMLLVSGFNVYPNEIEAVASEHPAVAECACIGVASEKTGESVKLFVVKKPGAELTEATLISHCRANMAAYKVPKEVAFVAALPKSTVGKILRRDLRQVV
jgi:long-chain acyl-CoA synthetase